MGEALLDFFFIVFLFIFTFVRTLLEQLKLITFHECDVGTTSNFVGECVIDIFKRDITPNS